MIRHVSSPDHIVSLSCSTLEDSIWEILERALPKTPPDIRRSLCRAMIQREKLKPTVLPNGVAFPRAEARCVKKIVCAIGISETGITDGNPADVPIRIMFVSLYPKGHFRKFVPVLENLVRFSQDPHKMSALERLPHHKEEFRVIRDEVFPRGIRELVHSHLFFPVHKVLNRM